MGETVVSCGDSAEVFEAPEHALDGIAIAIKVRREAVLPSPVSFGRDVPRGTLALDLATDGIAVILLVSM